MVTKSDVEKLRIVAGFGRSGTTWVQDVLATANRLRAVFEPLHPLWVEGADKYAHRYIDANEDEQECFDLLYKYFYGDFHSLWVDYRIVRPKLFPRKEDALSVDRLKRLAHDIVRSKENYLRFRHQRSYPQRIVKLIRANMMLAWLQRRFEARIVFIVRHPVPVVLSQQRAKRAWNPYECIDRYRRDERLLDSVDEKLRRLIFLTHDEVEAYSLCWCVENRVAIRQASESNIPVFFYEDLIRKGATEWKRLVAALELNELPEIQLISQPSQQAWGEKAKSVSLVRKYESWMNEVDESTRNRIGKVLDRAEVTAYAVSTPLPIGFHSD